MATYVTGIATLTVTAALQHGVTISDDIRMPYRVVGYDIGGEISANCQRRANGGLKLDTADSLRKSKITELGGTVSVAKEGTVNEDAVDVDAVL